ncbi:unnamed protein product [Durusdinium trenchii]|uniref:AN1-type domain-containing protein n=1 Tax=Durusdinium trenchii TaxID=1381693 RepID=A0ABP0L1I6_9DINO
MFQAEKAAATEFRDADGYDLVGACCALETCGLRDFLPFVCRFCGKKFCQDHADAAKHDCHALVESKGVLATSCPRCGQTVKWKDGESSEEQALQQHACAASPKAAAEICPAKGCKSKLTAMNSVVCGECKTKVCLKHRFEDQHPCRESKAEWLSKLDDLLGLGHFGDDHCAVWHWRSVVSAPQLLELKSRLGGTEEQKAVCLQTLRALVRHCRRLLSNVQKDPTNAKYRQDFMKALGFEEQGEILQLPEGVSLKRIDALLSICWREKWPASFSFNCLQYKNLHVAAFSQKITPPLVCAEAEGLIRLIRQYEEQLGKLPFLRTGAVTEEVGKLTKQLDNIRSAMSEVMRLCPENSDVNSSQMHSETRETTASNQSAASMKVAVKLMHWLQGRGYPRKDKEFDRLPDFLDLHDLGEALLCELNSMVVDFDLTLDGTILQNENTKQSDFMKKLLEINEKSGHQQVRVIREPLKELESDLTEFWNAVEAGEDASDEQRAQSSRFEETMFDHHYQVATNPDLRRTHLISERSMEAKVHVFNELTFKKGKLLKESRDEMQRKFHVNIRGQKCYQPHAVVFFEISVQKAHERIKERNRPGEEYITQDYLTDIEAKYAALYPSSAANVIRLDSDQPMEDLLVAVQSELPKLLKKQQCASDEEIDSFTQFFQDACLLSARLGRPPWRAEGCESGAAGVLPVGGGGLGVAYPRLAGIDTNACSLAHHRRLLCSAGSGLGAAWAPGSGPRAEASHLLLLRHGTPVPEEENPERPLSEQGRREAEDVAKKVTSYMSSTEGPIFLGHSGKLRAQETAESVASALRAAGREVICEEVSGINPKDDPTAAMELLSSPKAKVIVLVGHLPFMGQFAAAVLQSPAAAGRLGGLFHPASGLALKRSDASWQEDGELAASP